MLCRRVSFGARKLCKYSEREFCFLNNGHSQNKVLRKSLGQRCAGILRDINGQYLHWVHNSCVLLYIIFNFCMRQMWQLCYAQLWWHFSLPSPFSPPLSLSFSLHLYRLLSFSIVFNLCFVINGRTENIGETEREERGEGGRERDITRIERKEMEGKICQRSKGMSQDEMEREIQDDATVEMLRTYHHPGISHPKVGKMFTRLCKWFNLLETSQIQSNEWRRNTFWNK